MRRHGELAVVRDAQAFPFDAAQTLAQRVALRAGGARTGGAGSASVVEVCVDLLVGVVGRHVRSQRGRMCARFAEFSVAGTLTSRCQSVLEATSAGYPSRRRGCFRRIRVRRGCIFAADSVRGSRAWRGALSSQAARYQPPRAAPARSAISFHRCMRRIRAPRPPCCRPCAQALLRGPHERRIARADRLHQHEIRCGPRVGDRATRASRHTRPSTGRCRAARATRRADSSRSARGSSSGSVADATARAKPCNAATRLPGMPILRQIDGGERGGRRKAPGGVRMRMIGERLPARCDEPPDDGRSPPSR